MKTWKSVALVFGLGLVFATAVLSATPQKGPLTVTLNPVGSPPEIGETLEVELTVVSSVTIQPARAYFEVKGDLTLLTQSAVELGVLEKDVPRKVKTSVTINGPGDHEMTGLVRIIDVRSNSQYADSQTLFIHAAPDRVTVGKEKKP